MTTKLSFGRDINGYNAYAPSFSTVNQITTLSANVAQVVSVPSNFKNWIVAFSYQPGSSVWVALNAIAEIPGSSFSSSQSQLNPSTRTVQGGDEISLITGNTTAQVWVGFYALD